MPTRLHSGSNRRLLDTDRASDLASTSLQDNINVTFTNVFVRLFRSRYLASRSGLAQLVATLVGSTKLLYAGPG